MMVPEKESSPITGNELFYDARFKLKCLLKNVLVIVRTYRSEVEIPVNGILRFSEINLSNFVIF
jgi:hypothetical protein